MNSKLRLIDAIDDERERIVDMLLSMVIVILAVWACLPLIPRWIDNARLTEPLSVGKEISYHLALDYAFTGQWQAPGHIELPSSVASYSVTSDGDVQLTLVEGYTGHPVDAINWQRFRSGAGGYSMMAWRCGDRYLDDVTAPAPSYGASPLQQDIAWFICQ